MEQFYINTFRRFSNFELATVAGQGSNYILKNDSVLFEQDEELNQTIDYNELFQSADRIMKLYDANTWKKLYSLEVDLINSGEYLKAYFVRMLSQKCAVNYYESGRTISNKILLAWSLFFANKEEAAKDVINIEIKHSHLELTKSKLNLLLDILSGIVQKDYLQRKLSQYNLELYDRNVTVIGPLATEKQLEGLVEGEVIVQINYLKKNGKDPDISFYNGAITQDIDNGKSVLPELSYYVFHRFAYNFQNCLIKNDKAKLTYHCDYVFGLGQANMLPNVLFQLLAMKPNRIKVNGFNLYMSKTVYNNSYLNGDVKDRDISVLKKAFACHNIISQYQFISTLYQKGFFVADENLREILDNGIKYYLENLEVLIGKNRN